MTCPAGSGSTEWRGRFDKSLTTPNKDKVYAIINLRVAKSDTDYINYIQIRRNDTVLIHLGRVNLAKSDYVPTARWIRVVVPLPKNTTLTLGICVRRYREVSPNANGYAWLEDFKIISK
jgi:hypothetical protein